MLSQRHRNIYTVLIGLFWSAFIALQAQEVVEEQLVGEFEVSSGFSTSEVLVGREVTYTIQIKKGSVEAQLQAPEQPELPKSVAFSYGRFSTKEQYQSSLGDDPVGVLLEFEVVPNTEGRLIMPAFSMPYMGRELQIPAASIRVRSKDNDLLVGEFDWVVAELGEIPNLLRVGQRVKTSMNLYVFEGLRNVTFTNPAPVGSDFSLDQMVPGPTETVTSRGIYRYRLYRWPLTLTSLRKGRIAIAFKTNVNFRAPNDRVDFIRSIRMNNQRGNEKIEDLFLDSSQESLSVFSNNLNVTVEPLDETGLPGGFSRAIGAFELAVYLERTDLQVGEPVNLTVSISGTGNFGAFDAPSMNLDKRWRIFAPKESFDDQDFLGFKGRQVYEYVVIPLSRDIESFPSVELLYFDTKAGEFSTLANDPIPVKLAGESIVEFDPDETDNETVLNEPQSRQNLSDSIVWKLGKRKLLTSPFFTTVWFWLLNAALAAVFAFLAWQHLMKTRLKRDIRMVRRRRSEAWKRKYLNLAAQASKVEDSEQFYESAFLTFCAVVSAQSDKNVEAVTVEDVLQRVDELDLNENSKRVVENYMMHYEGHRFSGQTADDPPLKHEYSRLVSILKRVENELRSKTRKEGGQ